MKGMLAICSRGFVGLITEDKPKEVTYSDGKKGKAYVGIHLSRSIFGSPWSSRNPRLLMHASVIADLLRG